MQMDGARLGEACSDLSVAATELPNSFPQSLLVHLLQSNLESFKVSSIHLHQGKDPGGGQNR